MEAFILKHMNNKIIFVFGSNTEGRHGAGAAKYAKQHYGAIYGQPKGLQGSSYAIITKDLSKGYRSIPLEFIHEQIKQFIEFAKNNPDKIFQVTPIGCGLAGFKPEEIKPFFNNITNNIILPNEFK